MEYEQGSETGYVSDSSLTSRQGTKKKNDHREDRAYINRRKTKSERDKKRYSRALSQIEPLNDSESENSNESTQNQPKYRKRSGSKRNEGDKENVDSHSKRGSVRNSLVNNFSVTEEENEVNAEDSETHVHHRRGSRIHSFHFISVENLEENNDLDLNGEICSRKESTEHNIINKKPPMIKSNSSLKKCPILNNKRKSRSLKQINHSVENDGINKASRTSDHVERATSGLYEIKHSKHTFLDDFVPHRCQSVGSEMTKSYKFEISDYAKQHGKTSSIVQVSKTADMRGEERTELVDAETKQENRNSTATLKMDMKDIYCGTWNPKEQAVFNQVIQNMDTKGHEKKKFMKKLKVKGSKKENFSSTFEKENNEKLIYPLNEYVKSKESHNQRNKKFSGIFSGFKWFKDVLRRPDKSSKEFHYVYPREQQMIDFPQTKNKKILKKFRRGKSDDVCRRRAQSTNSHYSVDCLLNNDKIENCSINGSFATINSMRTLFKRTKSADNLNGAFEYFANQKQVFQRTTSVAKNLKSRNASCEFLDGNTGKDLSHTSLCHVFQPVRLESETEDSMYPRDDYQDESNSTKSKTFLSHQYDSAYEEERYYQCKNESSFFSSAPASHPGFSFMKTDEDELRKTYARSFHQHPRSLIQQHYMSSNAKIAHSECSNADHDITTFASYNSYSSSTSDYGNIPAAQMSVIPHHARKAIQRSLSKVNAESRKKFKNGGKGNYIEKVN